MNKRYVNEIDEWCRDWRLHMNPRKSTIVTCTYKHNINPSIKLADENVPQSETVKYSHFQVVSKTVGLQFVVVIKCI